MPKLTFSLAAAPRTCVAQSQCWWCKWCHWQSGGATCVYEPKQLIASIRPTGRIAWAFQLSEAITIHMAIFVRKLNLKCVPRHMEWNWLHLRKYADHVPKRDLLRSPIVNQLRVRSICDYLAKLAKRIESANTLRLRAVDNKNDLASRPGNWKWKLRIEVSANGSGRPTAKWAILGGAWFLVQSIYLWPCVRWFTVYKMAIKSYTPKGRRFDESLSKWKEKLHANLMLLNKLNNS